jgi:hypothetical protein
MRSLTCWLGWPPGHLNESVAFRDPVSGRWRAYARCLRCGRARTLAIGERRPAGSFSGNPLATSMAFGSRPADVPRRAQALVPHDAMTIEVPETGKALELRAARVAWGPWRGTTVYCARMVGGGDRPATSRDLRSALARAARTRPKAPWVEELARQLEHELTP